jgi:hypothetical protein
MSAGKRAGVARPITGPRRQSRQQRLPSRTGRVSSYLSESERPWASLLFVLPLVLLYALYTAGVFGSSTAAPYPSRIQQITAFTLVEELFSLFGAAGRHLPAFALVAMLLSAHLVRKDPWRLNLATIPKMAMEAIAWSAPLMVMGWILARFLPLSPSGPRTDLLFLCIGAGVYEELLFRLLAVTLLSLILRDLFALPPIWAWSINLILSGLLFSLYHYLSPHEVFAWRPFIFRTLAGVYLGLLFILRGFGITAGAHAVYDLIVVGFFAV